MDGIIRLLYSFKFTVFGIDIDSGNLIGTIEKLTNFSSVKGINIWSIGKTVNDVIVPIALSLLILFFMIINGSRENKLGKSSNGFCFILIT